MTPLYISIAALIVSVISLGWQVYKELRLRARLLVSLRTEICAYSNATAGTRCVVVGVANHGPGEVTISQLVVSSRQRGVKGLSYIGVHPQSPYTSPLPSHLRTGEQYRTSFPMEQKGWLKTKPARVGVLDALGRFHWVSADDIETVFDELSRA